MINRNNIREILVSARYRAISENGNRQTPKLDAIIEMLDKNPQMLNMEIILQEIGSSNISDEDKSCLHKKIMTIPIV